MRTRLTIARNVLQGALAMTEGFRGFRIYLTDATRDNIAVDEETLAITFIDLDDVIVQHEDLLMGNGKEAQPIHVHQKVDCDNCFAYSTNAICAAPVSDINVFTICQLLLEDLRDNPKGGFLYMDPRLIAPFPQSWKDRWSRVTDMLRSCVYCDNSSQPCQRFDLARDLVGELEILIQTATKSSLH